MQIEAFKQILENLHYKAVTVINILDRFPDTWLFPILSHFNSYLEM